MSSDQASQAERLARNMGSQDALNDLCDFLERELRKLDSEHDDLAPRQVVLRDVVRWAEAQRAMIMTEDQRIQIDQSPQMPSSSSDSISSPRLKGG